MGFGQGLGDGQPDARPTVSPVTSGVNPVEAVEHAGQVLRGDAVAGVLDAQFRKARSGGAGDRDGDGSAGGGVPQGIVEQVAQYLADSVRVRIFLDSLIR